MSRWLLFTVIASCWLLPAMVAAQEKPSEAARRRVLLLLKHRPLLVELILTIDEQPFVASEPAAFAVQGQAFLAGRADGSQLLDLVDRNGDGQLSDEEMDGAPDRLRSSDADDNELVTLTEIAGFRADMAPTGAQATASQESILPISDTTDWKQLQETLVARYGKKKVLPWAMSLGENGELLADELPLLATMDAPLVLNIALGTRTKLRDTVVVEHIADELKRIARIDRGADGKLLLDFISLRIEVLAPNPKPTPRMFAGQATAYMSNFDKDKNGYLERKELTNPALAPQFDAWDQDRNGMVYTQEIQQALEAADRPNWQKISVAALVQGNDLFGQLDENGDQQLGHKEVRSAGEKLRTIALDEDETIRVAVARGTETYKYLAKGSKPLSRRATASGPFANGPDWFVHMDTNGDGDVTRREFLGTAEQFAKMDANQDGVLEADEAK